MKKTLVCISKGSVGRVCLDILKKKDIYKKKIEILNISKKKINKSVLQNKLKKISNHGPIDVMIGFASIKNRKINEEIFNFLKNLNYNIVNIFHPTSILDQDIKLGKGIRIWKGVIICKGVKIKNNVLITTGSIIDHDCIINSHVQISSGCNLAGNVEVGKLSFIGMGTNIIQGVKIGKNCIIGAGSVVLKNIPDNSFYAGSPAKKIK